MTDPTTFTCPTCNEERNNDDASEASCLSCGVCALCRPTSGGCGASEYCECCRPACARCDNDTTADLIRHLEEGGPTRCSHCGLDLPEPSAEWLAANGYETEEV